MIVKLRTRLLALCRNSVLDASVGAVVPEPYIPCIPEPWNGVLVLAEAQNMSRRNEAYVTQLKSLRPSQRFLRLGRRSITPLGVKPWDDGTLKLAVEAALSLKAHETAVSNAVLWSTVTTTGTNENPRADMIAKSVDLWEQMLAVMTPTTVVTAGAVARNVVADALKRVSSKSRHIAWALPSPRVLAPLSAMVTEAELRTRFPEVDSVLARRQGWALAAPLPGKVMYACLAVLAVGPHRTSKRWI